MLWESGLLDGFATTKEASKDELQADSSPPRATENIAMPQGHSLWILVKSYYVWVNQAKLWTVNLKGAEKIDFEVISNQQFEKRKKVKLLWFLSPCFWWMKSSHMVFCIKLASLMLFLLIIFSQIKS